MNNKIYKVIKVIKIWWNGPFNVEDPYEDKFDLYQIYGTHAIYGRCVLLYIGRTDNGYIRIKNHFHDWMKFEFDSMQYFAGKIIDCDEQYLQQYCIDAERLLVYYCAPAYNSNLISDLKVVDQNLLVLNFGKAGQLPCEASTIWYSEYDKYLKNSSE